MKYFNLIIVLILLCIGCTEQEKLTKEDNSTDVYINMPEYGAVLYSNDQPIMFKGTARSVFNDHSDKIKWTSDVDGDLGTGAIINVTLTINNHKITATYSDDQTSSSYTIPIQMKSEEIFKKEKIKYTPRILEFIDQDGAILLKNFDNNTIIDKSTNLMWMSSFDHYKYTINEALILASQSTHAGYTNWRIPTFNELKDISNIYYDGRKTILHREFGVANGHFWTTTPYESQFSDNNKYRKTIKYFISDVLNRAPFAEEDFKTEISSNYVRLVRNID